MPIKIVEVIDKDYVMGEYPSHPGVPVKLYAHGNSLGRRALTAAEAAPWLVKGRTATGIKTTARARKLGKMGGERKRDLRRERITEAHANALSSAHPDLQTEEDGLKMIAEASFMQATDENGGGPAVKAREQFFQEYTGGRQDTQATEEHKHLHITISPGVEVEQRHMMRQLMDVVEGEVRDVGDGGDADEG